MLVRETALCGVTMRQAYGVAASLSQFAAVLCFLDLFEDLANALVKCTPQGYK